MLKKKILGFALGSLLAGTVFAGSSVAVVDLTQVFQNAPQGSAAFASLKQQIAPQVNQLQTAQQNLQNQETALQANKSLSKKAKAQQQAALAAQSQSLQQNIQSLQQSASQQEQALISSFGNVVKTTVAQIAKQNGYDLVLTNQATLYNTDKTDITPQVLSLLQQQAAASAHS